jgi:precorrin-6A/cobalt-precorrin-6A reductase
VTAESRPYDVPRILVLAGSTEAKALATRLAASPEVAVVSSFAGRVKDLSLPAGEVRIGGFGGPAGLARWIVEAQIAAVIDATHPFTAHMPNHVVVACESVDVPHLRVLRSQWEPEPGDRWTVVPDLVAAAAQLGDIGARRVFLTTGRQELAPFAQCDPATWFLVRAIEMPDPLPLAQVQVVLSRGPFGLDNEVSIMRTHRIDTLVTKNSGGEAAAAKLAAARILGIEVVMIARPPTVGPSVATTEEAIAWCREILGVAVA